MLRNKASEVGQVTRAARRTTFAAVTAVCTVLGLASCASSSGGGATSNHATLVFDNIAPFTGPNAAFGPGLMAGAGPQPTRSMARAGSSAIMSRAYRQTRGVIRQTRFQSYG